MGAARQARAMHRQARTHCLIRMGGPAEVFSAVLCVLSSRTHLPWLTSSVGDSVEETSGLGALSLCFSLCSRRSRAASKRLCSSSVCGTACRMRECVCLAAFLHEARRHDLRKPRQGCMVAPLLSLQLWNRILRSVHVDSGSAYWTSAPTQNVQFAREFGSPSELAQALAIRSSRGRGAQIFATHKRAYSPS